MSNSSSGSSNESISAEKAVALGHVIVNIPVLMIMLGFILVGWIFFKSLWLVFLLIGFVLGWLWWAFTVPRWRRWALRRGAPAAALQKLAVSTGLVWPKGSTPEKTEFKVPE